MKFAVELLNLCTGEPETVVVELTPEQRADAACQHHGGAPTARRYAMSNAIQQVPGGIIRWPEKVVLVH